MLNCQTLTVFFVTPEFNLQRILRQGVTKDTPFISGFYTTNPLQKACELLVEYPRACVMSLSIPRNEQLAMGVTITGNRVEIQNLKCLRGYHVITVARGTHHAAKVEA